MKKSIMYTKTMDSDNDDDDEFDDKNSVKCVNNNIYFYCTVSTKSVLKLNTMLEEMQVQILSNQLN